MIRVEDAEKIVLTHVMDLGIEEVDISEALNRVLQEPIYTDRDMPPFNRVSMDGIAIRWADFDSGLRTFPIKGIAAAGTPIQSTEDSGICFEVMTGCVLPNGLDTVIRYEDVKLSEESAEILISEIKPYQNVHSQSKDRNRGDLLIRAGTKISPVEIGICASVGLSKVKVSKLAKLIIISTGDELVDIDQTPLPHQIRKSNVERIKAHLKSYSIRAVDDHLPDDKSIMLDKLKNHIQDYDVIILSGGVSMGKFDYVPEILSQLGVEKLFHKVKQRPGKPFWFGKSESTVVFALPGNPNSSFVCTLRYLIPWLAKCSGLRFKAPSVQLTQDVIFKKALTRFLSVSVNITREGILKASPIHGHGSGDFASLTDATGYLELPEDRDLFKEGESFNYYAFR